MQRMHTSEANRDPGAVWRAASTEPVWVEEDGKPVAIVLSPQAYSDLLVGHGPRSGTARRHGSRLTVDSNELFGLSDDVFCNDGP